MSNEDRPRTLLGGAHPTPGARVQVQEGQRGAAPVASVRPVSSAPTKPPAGAAGSSTGAKE